MTWSTSLEMLGNGHICDVSALGENPFMLDLGACTGQFLATFKELRPNSSCMCIEADPNNFQHLLHNANSYSKCTFLHGAVIEGEEETVTFYSVGGRPQWGSVHDSHGGRPVEVKAINLNSLAGLPPKIDYVKMDIEGAELGVITSASKELMNSIHQISIEVHMQDEGPLIASCLESHGFKVGTNQHQQELEVFGIK